MHEYLALIIVFLLLFTSCSITADGNNLKGFTERMNTAYDCKDFSVSGYINNSSECTFTRFFKFPECEIFLTLTRNEEYELVKMSLCGKKGAEDSDDVYLFLENAVKSFYVDGKKGEALLSSLNLKEALKENTLKTKKTETDGAEMLIDVADPGWVITVRYNTRKAFRQDF